MKSWNKRLFLLIQLLFFFAFPGLVQAETVAFIDSVEFDDSNHHTDVTLTFIAPVNYLRHFPADHGREIDILIQTLALATTDQLEIRKEQLFSYQDKKNLPVQQIKFDPNAVDGLSIHVRLASDMKFTITQKNERSLVIRIEKPEQAQREPVAPVAEVPPAPAVAPLPFTTAKQPATAGEPELVDPKMFGFVINLESSQALLAMPVLQDPELASKYHLYRSTIVLKGVTWYRSRLGFFKNTEEANRILLQARKQFASAWLDRTRDADLPEINAWINDQPSMSRVRTAVQLPSEQITANAGQVSEADELLARAKESLTSGDNNAAIRYLTKLLNLPENKDTPFAQELLGVARERNQQLAHAIAEYRIYLERYPKGEGASRVKQRLQALLTVRSNKPGELRKVSPKTRKSTPWQVYGSVFQFYRRDVDTTDPAQDLVVNNSLDTDISVTARRRDDKYDIRTQFAGSYQYDLENSDQSELRVSSLYVDAADRDRNWNARFGRQSQSTAGVLGRFDGLAVGHRLSPRWKINAVAGFPVTLAQSNTIQTDRYFYGLSLDAGNFAKYWNFSFFTINQTAEDITDRTAVGTEIRYVHPKRSLFALIDYDTSYGTLNTVQIITNARVFGETNISLVGDYRKSPILTTTNALQGQTVTSLTELLNTYTEDQIRQLAQDRTALFRSVYGTITTPIRKDLLITGELGASHLTGTPASGGVDAIPGTGMEYSYATQLIASNVFRTGDTTLLGLRYSDTSSANTLTFSLNSRYPINKQWRLDPRLRIDSQDRTDGSTIMRYRPSIRADYRAKRNIKFETEFGYEQSNISDSVGDRVESGYFFSLGYIADF